MGAALVLACRAVALVMLGGFVGISLFLFSDEFRAVVWALVGAI
jgi:hypothetical protein